LYPAKVIFTGFIKTGYSWTNANNSPILDQTSSKKQRISDPNILFKKNGFIAKLPDVWQ